MLDFSKNQPPPPEMRENTGEIDLAAEKNLPALVDVKDMRGDLQMHTTASDGRNSIEEMAEAARALGYSYIALTDHSKSVTVANGLDEKRTLEQIKLIRAAEKKMGGFRILAGSEVDILKDGRLDMDDEVLAQLDVVVCSIHSFMNLERAAMTERMLAAIGNLDDAQDKNDAVDFLKGLLADGPVEAGEIETARKKCGVSDYSLRAAKTKLRVVTKKTGNAKDGTQKWTWELPAAPNSQDVDAPLKTSKSPQGVEGNSRQRLDAKHSNKSSYIKDLAQGVDVQNTQRLDGGVNALREAEI